MQIRDNVRRRRRERIMQLLAHQPVDPGEGATAAFEASPLFEALPAVPSETTANFTDSEADPERWWKEQQKRKNGSAWSWTGTGGVPGAGGPIPPSRAPVKPPAIRSRYTAQLARGFAIRLTVAAVLFGAAYGWLHAKLPGSGAARSWMIAAVTRDMDFQAVEAWYEQTFGDSPSFLPMFRSRGESKAVSGVWKKNDAVLPVDGHIVRTFALDGTGVRIAAPGGSGVKAVYAGRVLQVALEEDGKATVLVQHAGRIVTVYGNLNEPAVRPNDWVEAGQRLGTIPAPLDQGGESLLYFAVKQDDKTLDPADVVPFD